MEIVHVILQRYPSYILDSDIIHVNIGNYYAHADMKQVYRYWL